MSVECVIDAAATKCQPREAVPQGCFSRGSIASIIAFGSVHMHVITSRQSDPDAQRSAVHGGCIAMGVSRRDVVEALQCQRRSTTAGDRLVAYGEEIDLGNERLHQCMGWSLPAHRHLMR